MEVSFLEDSKDKEALLGRKSQRHSKQLSVTEGSRDQTRQKMAENPRGHSCQHEQKGCEGTKQGILMQRNTDQILRNQYGWAGKGLENLNPAARLRAARHSLNTGQSSRHSQASGAGGRHYSPISLLLAQMLLN